MLLIVSWSPCIPNIKLHILYGKCSLHSGSVIGGGVAIVVLVVIILASPTEVVVAFAVASLESSPTTGTHG